MSRDEKKTRAKEIAPHIYGNAIYPKDSEARGTWFATNGNLIFTLLNRYDAITHNTNQSRGKIILSLLSANSIKEACNTFQALLLHEYAPFTLLIIDANETIRHDWNGKQNTQTRLENSTWQHVTSSSWRQEEVLPWREEKFVSWVGKEAAILPNNIPTFHLYTEDNKATHSPLMTRKHSETRSIIQAYSDKETTHVNYWPERHKFNAAPDVQLIL
jgi:hypothetical protein